MSFKGKDSGAWLLLLLSASASGQETKEIQIIADEFTFRPAQIRVSRGPLKITVVNRGAFPHGLAIVGRDEKIGYIESGETQSIAVIFDKPGEVIFYCPQPGHRGKGMAGKLSIGRP